VKGCQILASIRDVGLLLLPEYFEWHQPTTSGVPRSFPVLQSRVCFTDLHPSELAQHAARFGEFSLEFDHSSLRALGAIPVFYIPQPMGSVRDGNGVGAALIAIATDARVAVQRMALLENCLNGPVPVNPEIELNLGFVGSPNDMGNFRLSVPEAKNFLRAIGHGITPWMQLSDGLGALLNYFYPADDARHDKLLDYYRQREWRIACKFAVEGAEVLRAATEGERNRILEIDPAFFGRQITTDNGVVNALDHALLHAGIDGNAAIEMVRRVIVPEEAVEDVTRILAKLASPPPVIRTEDVEREFVYPRSRSGHAS
jgi:hypothetical protein